MENSFESRGELIEILREVGLSEPKLYSHTKMLKDAISGIVRLESEKIMVWGKYKGIDFTFQLGIPRYQEQEEESKSFESKADLLFLLDEFGVPAAIARHHLIADSGTVCREGNEVVIRSEGEERRISQEREKSMDTEKRKSKAERRELIREQNLSQRLGQTPKKAKKPPKRKIGG